MGEIAEALQRSAVGRALFAITTGSLTKGTSREVTKFPNDMKSWVINQQMEKCADEEVQVGVNNPHAAHAVIGSGHCHQGS